MPRTRNGRRSLGNRLTDIELVVGPLVTTPIAHCKLPESSKGPRCTNLKWETNSLMISEGVSAGPPSADRRVYKVILSGLYVSLER